MTGQDTLVTQGGRGLKPEDVSADLHIQLLKYRWSRLKRIVSELSAPRPWESSVPPVRLSSALRTDSEAFGFEPENAAPF